MVLTTDCLIAEEPQKDDPTPGAGAGAGMGGMPGMMG
jgi:hypothetical protein